MKVISCLIELTQLKKHVWTEVAVIWMKNHKKNDPFYHINMATTLQQTQIFPKIKKLHLTNSLILLGFKYLGLVTNFFFAHIHQKFASFLYKNLKMCHSEYLHKLMDSKYSSIQNDHWHRNFCIQKIYTECFKWTNMLWLSGVNLLMG